MKKKSVQMWSLCAKSRVSCFKTVRGGSSDRQMEAVYTPIIANEKCDSRINALIFILCKINTFRFAKSQIIGTSSLYTMVGFGITYLYGSDRYLHTQTNKCKQSGRGLELCFEISFGTVLCYHLELLVWCLI